MTKSDLVKLGKILKFLGIDPDISNFDSRLRIQKITYILKSMGVSLSYNFNFHYYGVFSRDLQTEYYHHFNTLKDSYSDSDLDKEEIDKLNLFKKIDYLNNETLKAISTIMYMKIVYANEDEVIERTRRVKPELDHDTILLAQNTAKMLLFQRPYLTSEVNEELQVWDALNDYPIS